MGCDGALADKEGLRFITLRPSCFHCVWTIDSEKTMTSEEQGRVLHDKLTRGEALSNQEQAELEQWYDQWLKAIGG